MNSSASRWRKASAACAKSGTPRISWVLGPGTARILQLARLRVAIEEGPELRPDRHHQAEVVFEGARVLEPADLSERVGNRGRRNGDEDGVGVSCIAAVVAESRNRVPRLLPPVGEPAADVAPADDC